MSSVNHTQALLNPDYRPKNALQFTQVLRFFNVILAFVIIAFSVFCYVVFKIQENINFLDDPSLTVLPACVILSGLIILGVQFNIDFVVNNFKFMFHYIGRGIFNIYVGVLCLAMIRSSSETIYKVIIYISGGLMVLFGAFYIVIAVCCCANAKDHHYQKQKQSLNQGADGINTTQQAAPTENQR